MRLKTNEEKRLGDDEGSSVGYLLGWEDGLVEGCEEGLRLKDGLGDDVCDLVCPHGNAVDAGHCMLDSQSPQPRSINPRGAEHFYVNFVTAGFHNESHE